MVPSEHSINKIQKHSVTTPCTELQPALSLLDHVTHPLRNFLRNLVLKRLNNFAKILYNLSNKDNDQTTQASASTANTASTSKVTFYTEENNTSNQETQESHEVTPSKAPAEPMEIDQE